MTQRRLDGLLTRCVRVCVFAPQMTATEQLFQARQQMKHPHFVTVTFAKDYDKETKASYQSFTAYQVSDQAVKLVKERRLEAVPKEPFHVHAKKYKRAHTLFHAHSHT